MSKESEVKQTEESSLYPVTIEINARLQPFDRGDLYEDPIAEALESTGLGAVVGGGTLMQRSGEVGLCDVHIDIIDSTPESIAKLMEIIEGLRLPKGSFLKAENLEQPVGILEGLALYLNGTELPDEVYKTSDINHVVAKINEMLTGVGAMYSHWRGPEETALYFYGVSFEEMKRKMEPFLAEYPLCQKCRVEQIA